MAKFWGIFLWIILFSFLNAQEEKKNEEIVKKLQKQEKVLEETRKDILDLKKEISKLKEILEKIPNIPDEKKLMEISLQERKEGYERISKSSYPFAELLPDSILALIVLRSPRFILQEVDRNKYPHLYELQGILKKWGLDSLDMSFYQNSGIDFQKSCGLTLLLENSDVQKNGHTFAFFFGIKDQEKFCKFLTKKCLFLYKMGKITNTKMFDFARKQAKNESFMLLRRLWCPFGNVSWRKL